MGIFSPDVKLFYSESLKLVNINVFLEQVQPELALLSLLVSLSLFTDSCCLTAQGQAVGARCRSCSNIGLTVCCAELSSSPPTTAGRERERSV